RARRTSTAPTMRLEPRLGSGARGLTGVYERGPRKLRSHGRGDVACADRHKRREHGSICSALRAVLCTLPQRAVEGGPVEDFAAEEVTEVFSVGRSPLI